MTTDVQKYRATMFQIAGFALISPIGKIVLNALDFTFSDIFSIKFFAYLFFTLFLLVIGIIFISRGIAVLEGKV